LDCCYVFTVMYQTGSKITCVDELSYFIGDLYLYIYLFVCDLMILTFLFILIAFYYFQMQDYFFMTLVELIEIFLLHWFYFITKGEFFIF
jgi:hypothetical protein